MFNVKDIALEILNGHIDVPDLVGNAEFLREVDSAIVALSKDSDVWPDILVAKKRKAILKKIDKLLD